MIKGTTEGGVPFVASPPAGGARRDAAAVVAWHLLDAPRTESAFAAAVPLDGLDAWRVYFGLPFAGSRLPAGGYEELHRLLLQDAVLNVHQHVTIGGADEFPAAWAEVRDTLGIADGPIGIMGGSMGGMVAQLAAVESGADVRALVLINPVVRMRSSIDGIVALHDTTYPWSPEADRVAERTDMLTRAGELENIAIRFIVGENDMRAAILEPVAEAVPALRKLGATVDQVIVPGMAHALAEEPGTEPAPQTSHAAEVDRHAVAWFTAHLTGPAR